MLYFDNCATTKVDEEVLKAMLPYFISIYGNPESKFYSQAVEAKKAVEEARMKVSKLINCNANEVIFNSGASEGNNTVLKGIIDNSPIDSNIITTSIEHSSVYETCQYIEKKGYEVKYINVDKDGVINIEDLIREINNKTKLVSIIWVNNEFGSIQPIKEIAKLCYDNNIPLHVDATQAVGRMRINLAQLPGISFMTFSGHKINGPKGIGSLVVRKNKDGIYTDITPLIHGGNQEYGYRSGTSNVPGIVGLGKACEILNLYIDNNVFLLRSNTVKVRDILISKFKDRIKINNNIDKSAPGILSVRFIGINNEVLLKSVSQIMAASSGSACSNLKPSRVLKSIGLTDKEISESIRISLPVNISEFDLYELGNL